MKVDTFNSSRTFYSRTLSNPYMFFKRILIVILFSGLLILSVRSQDIDTTILKIQATEMAESLMKKDYATLAKYTHPKIVALMGGEESMITVLSDAMDKMKKEGFIFLSCSVGLTPLKAQADTEIHAIVAQTIVMTVPGGTVTSNSFLLAITADNGNRWYFVDTARLTDIDKIKAMFPNYNPDLKIPKKEPPIFNKNQ